ncbi:MAG: FAD:protein FMN transferase [Xanthomonadaceae bacterium]|jgi:thiamine biosynthesis lipoprotein|nr:FAD:protein FMN transferase [Xanthomonadaceae bacterium]
MLASHAPASDAIATLGGQSMGTSWSAKLVLPRRDDMHRWHMTIQTCLDTVVAQMSHWEPDSDLSRFNRASAGTWHVLPADFLCVLNCAIDIARKSDGAYDPTVGPLVALWGFGPAQGPHRVPAADMLDAVRQQVGWQRIQIDEKNFRILQPGALHLDFSAIAKGYAVDLVVHRLRAAGIASALVEVGGEIHGFGTKPDGSAWQVLIEATPDESADERFTPRIVSLAEDSLATSGDRWHRFHQDGHSYSHTFDPRTGTTVKQVDTAVTVLASDTMRADAWATALMVMEMEHGLSFAEEHGLAARFVRANGSGIEEAMTRSFQARLTR